MIASRFRGPFRVARNILASAWFGLLVAVSVIGAMPVAASSAHSTTTLRVFAAASLSDAFGELARRFEAAHAGTAVQLNLAGSQQLAAQLEQGAAADVFASADARWMDTARQKDLIDGDAVTFARNRLIVIVPRTNPARIGRLQDLAKRGVKVVLGETAVPVGNYSRQVLQNLARTDGFNADYAKRVFANVVSEEDNVKSVVAKVQLGEADAGLVYRSDVTPSVARYVRMFTIPDSANVLATYPIAVVKGTRHADLAREFIAWATSAEGQAILQRHGLIPAGP